MDSKRMLIVALAFLGAVPPLALEWLRAQSEARTDPPGTDGAGMAMFGVYMQGLGLVITIIILVGIALTKRRRE